MNRDQMEAHLMLHGWEPMFVGQGAAVDEFELVVYVFDKHDPASRFTNAKVEAAQQTLEQLNLKRKSGAKTQRADCWYMSDRYFWPLAHACVAATNTRK